MFITLLVINFIISFLVCFIITLIFRKSIDKILQRLITEAIYTAWTKYLIFAIYVVGISGGVRVWDLEKYITSQADKGSIVALTGDRWVLEIYHTIIGTLQSDAWMLLLFFLGAMVAFVIIRSIELWKQQKS